MSQDFLNKLANILDSQLSNETFGVSELANEIGISRSQLHRKLQTITGKSTSQFIREYRLNKALEMLQTEEATASEVAYNTGFNSPSYFNTSFKDYFGFTPGEAKTANIKAKPIDEMKKSSSNFSFFNSTTFRIGVVLVFLIAITIGLLKTFNKSSSDQENNIIPVDSIKVLKEKTLAIMPFASLSNLEENEFFTEGIRQDIIDNLSRIENVVVKSQQSVSRLKDSNLSIKELGETLGIDYLVGGSVQRYEDRVKIRVHLTDTSRDVQIWSQDFDREYKDIFTLESDISRQIAYELDLILTPNDLEFFEKVPTDNLEAYRYYNKARYHMWDYNMYDADKTDIELSQNYFRKCIELDSDFALAYSGLGEAILWEHWPTPSVEIMSEIKSYALKAISITNDISDPHRVLAWYYLNYERDWKKSEEEFKLSLRYNPNNPLTYCMYSQYMHYVLGDFDGAQNLLDKALLIFPNSFYANMLFADYKYQQGQYTEALRYANLAESAVPSDLWPYWTKFLIYSQQGKDNQAVQELEEGWNIYSHIRVNIKPMKEAYHENGINGVFLWLNHMDINDPFATNVNHNAFWIAQKYGYLGDGDSAIKWLNKAYENNNADMFRVKYDSAFTFLHENQEFLQLLEKLNLGTYNSNSLKL